MRLEPPTVGPIVGYTTTRQTRIWLRGTLKREPDGFRRCFGAIRLKEHKEDEYEPPRIVKLEPHFDVTGVAVFGDLKPDQLYDYQAGWFFLNANLENLDPEMGFNWEFAYSGSFKTGTQNEKTPRNYIIGSCRYLLSILGTHHYDERGDKTFRSILEQYQNAKPRVDAIMMMGDQIYADDMARFAPDRSVKQFLKRYRAVFGQKHIRKLMSQVPTYMVLDDHEIEDNWPAKKSKQEVIGLYPHAMHAYQIYQCSHGPLLNSDENGRLLGRPEKWWYKFQDGCCDWFVLDCRIERELDGDTHELKMINKAQLQALLNWLSENSDSIDKPRRVKVIVSSVPFFPDIALKNPDKPTSEWKDKWSGFGFQRMQILEHIRKNKIRNVVFFSGDVHCSFSSELMCKDGDLKVISVISSAFFGLIPI